MRGSLSHPCALSTRIDLTRTRFNFLTWASTALRRWPHPPTPHVRMLLARHFSLRVLQMAPIPELFAVRVDRSYKVATTAPLKVITGIVTHPLALLDTPLFPKPSCQDFQTLLRFGCVLLPRHPGRDFLSRDAASTAAGTVSKADSFAIFFFSRAVPISISSALCVPQGTFFPRFYFRPLYGTSAASTFFFSRSAVSLAVSAVSSATTREPRSSHHQFGSPFKNELALPVDPRASSQSCAFSVAQHLQMSTCTSRRLRSVTVPNPRRVPARFDKLFVVDCWSDQSGLRCRPVPATLQDVTV